MTLDAENLKSQIPYYLTAAPAQKELVENLSALSNGAKRGYYISAAREHDDTSMLQGDGWRGFQILSFASGEKRSIRGIVLSNSCDISPENERAIPNKVVFAPIVKLSAVEARFASSGLSGEAIRAKVASIKLQSVTNVFYLPAGGELEEDYVVFLDDLHSMPVAVLEREDKIFTLSMAGFYLFAFKLSIHFCRLHENIDRRDETAAA